MTEEASAAWSLAWRMGVGSRLTDAMMKLFRTHDQQAVALGRERLYAALATLEREHLSALAAQAAAGQGGFLGGEHPGLSDIAVAAICAPMAMPTQFARGRFAKWFDMLLEKDADMKREVERFRETAAGSHCLKVYDACRVQPLALRAGGAKC